MADFIPPAVLELLSKFDDSGVQAAMKAVQEVNALKAVVKIKAEVEGRQELAALKAQIASMRDKSVKVKATTETSAGGGGGGAKAGQQWSGEFERVIKTNLAAAQRALPKLEVGVARTEADQALKDLSARMAALSGKRIGIDIDAAVAITEIVKVREELDRLGASTPDIQVRADTAAASMKLTKLHEEARRLAMANPSIKVDVDGGGAMAQLAALRTAAVGAGGGMQWLIAAGIGIAPAIVPAAGAAASAIVGIGTAASVAGAGLGALMLGTMNVIKAVQAMGQAQKSAGGSSKDSTDKAYQMANALDAARSAQRQAADATREAATAEYAITAAREAARRSIEDLNLDLRQNSLDERQGALNVRKALEELRRVRADSSASRTDRQQAQLSYEQAQASLSRLGVQTQRLATDTADANQRGVAGSDQVTAAQDRIREAQERVTVSAEQIAAAQRQVEQASKSTGVTGVAAMNTLNDAMSKLSPTGQHFATFLYGLINGPLRQLQHTAEEGLLPGVESGLKSLMPYMPQINAFVGTIAKSLGNVAESALKSLSNPEFQKFFTYLGSVGGPMLESMGKIAINFAQAFASIMVAFGPTTDQMTGGLVDMSKKFADWAANLSNNPGFQKFLAYIKENGPKIATICGDLGKVALKLGEGFAPLGKLVLDSLVKVLDWLAGLNTGQLMALAGAIGAIGLAIAIAAGGPIVAIVAAIMLVDAALVYAWTHCETFRSVVTTVFNAVKAVIGFVWDNVIKPVFNALKFYITDILAPWFMWLYEHVVKPVWGAIQTAFSIGWALIQVVFGLIVMGLKALAQPFMWLYDNTIKPLWDKYLKPFFSWIGNVWKDDVNPKLKSAIDTAGKIFDKLIDYAKMPIKIVVGFVNDGIIDNYNKLAGKFGGPHVDRIQLPKGFAKGGVIPGFDTGVDSVMAMMRPGEGVLVPEAVRALGGPSSIAGINSAATSGGLGGLAAPSASGTTAMPQVTVQNNVVVMLPDGTQLHAQIMDVSQQYKFRSSVSGMG